MKKLALFLFLSWCVQSTLGAPAGPNIVCFLCDDLSLLDSSPYGATDVRTPNLQRLAGEGLVFDRAFIASPACAPSRTAMLCGLMPARNGAEANHTFARPEIRGWPSYLRELGYDTAAFGKVAHGADVKRWGFSHFDMKFDLDLVRAYVNQRQTDKPLCLFVGTHDPHVPWDKNRDYDPSQVKLPWNFVDTPQTREYRTDYYTEVTRADTDMGTLYDFVSQKLGTNTLFLFSSDHGAQWPFGKWNLYDTSIRSPLLAVWPGVIRPGARTDAMVSWVDFMPTLIELAGGTPPAGLDGKSFAGLLLDRTTQHRSEIYTTHSGDGRMNVYPIRALRTDRFKYVRNLFPTNQYTTHIDRADNVTSGLYYWRTWVAAAKTNADTAAIVRRYHDRPAEELYDVAADPAERLNLAGNPDHAATLKALRDEVDVWMKQQGDEGKLFNQPYPLGTPELGETSTVAQSSPEPAAGNSASARALVPMASEKEVLWRHTTQAPKAGWNADNFNDAAWPASRGPFGAGGNFIGPWRTPWKETDIWLRHTFALDKVPQGRIALRVFHDEDVEIYLNGRLVLERKGFLKQPVTVPLEPAATALLRQGSNLLAVHCHQTRGGQGIDVGLMLVGDTNSAPSSQGADAGERRANESPAAAGSTSSPLDPRTGTGHLMTRWAKDVTPDNVWAEYPRPQMVRSDWQSLNGLWDYAITGQGSEWKKPNVENAVFDPLAKGAPATPSAWEGKILVPFAVESALSGVGKLVRPEQLLWYRRQFAVPEPWRDRRILLHFEAVDWHTVVWVNGKKLGENKGSYTPFSFDITEALRPAGVQELVLAVWDPSNAGDQAIGKQALPEIRKGFRYTPTTGIWQPVWLEPVPASHIQRVKVTPQVDQGAVEIAVETAGSDQAAVEIQLLDKERIVARETGKPGAKLSLKIPEAKLWSPESPFLYDLKVKSGTDEVNSYFGMRKIAVAPDAAGIPRIQLNGKEIFSFGPLDQGYWPDGVLTPPSDAAAKYDVQYLRDIGCNMVRVHIKVHPARWYYWCDRLGLMVWQDFVCMPKYGSEIRPSSSAQWEQEQTRLMDHLHNHPSIVEWIVFNEGWGQYDTERLTGWVTKRDPSRIVCGVTGWTDKGVGHTYDIHDYSFHPSIARPGQLGARAMSVGECGGFNVWIPGHLWGDYSTKETIDEIGEGGRESYLSASSWEKRYGSWLDSLALLRSLGLCAAVYTQITDVEHECNGWLTYDRAVSKIPVDRLRALHERLYQPPPVLKPLVPLSAAQQPARVFQDGQLPDLPQERSFNLNQVPSRVVVRMDGVGSARIFLNGKLVKELTSHDRAGYVPVSLAVLSPAAVKALRPGTNMLKVEPQSGGRGKKKTPAGDRNTPLDVGLFEYDIPY